MKLLSRRTLLAGVATTLALPHTAFSQDSLWPRERALRWLIGLPPGGGGDAITRLTATRLQALLGQNIIVDNKPGANQALALQAVTQSEPDGYTLISLAGPTFSAKPPAQIGKGLEPVAMLGSGPMVLAGTTNRATPDLASVVRAAKANQKEWSFASGGAATAPHVAGELINKVTGMKALHVAYQGGGPAVRDAVAGHVPLIVVGPGPLRTHLESGALRAYAVTSAQRSSLLPDVPTLKELGYGDIDLMQWSGVAVRTGTPANLVQRLSSDIRQVLATEAVRDAMRLQGLESRPDVSAADWGRFFAADQANWSALVRDLGIDLG